MEKHTLLAKVCLLLGLVVFATSCSNDDNVVQPKVDAVSYTGLAKAYSEDGEVSLDIALKSDNESVMDEYLNAYDYKLIKDADIDAYNTTRSSQDYDADVVDSEMMERGTLGFEIQGQPLEGYHIIFEPKQSDFKSLYKRYVSLYVNLSGEI